jgi:DNA repair protein RadC
MPVAIHNLPEFERPRERLIAAGREALSDVELVALVLGGDLGCASALVATHGGAPGLSRALLGELRAVRGIGEARACRLLASLELGRRASRTTDEERPPVKSPREVVALLGTIAEQEQEELHVLGLDARHHAVTRFLAAKGSLNVVHVHPRDVFRRLVREGAAAAIVAHNHPSGDPSPSPDDLALTRRLAAAGDLLGVPLLDHLVIARRGFHSFSDEIERTPKG